MLLHSIAKSVVKSIFSLHPLPVISTPKPPFFARSSHFWSENHLFRGVFLFTLREILARNRILRRKNQFDGVFFRPKYRNSTFAGEEKEKEGVSSPPSPTPFEKYKPTFSPNVPTFRDFLPCFSQNLPTPHKIPFTLRAGHAPTRIYALAHSANLPFLPSPFTSPRNKLYISCLSVKTSPAFTFTFTAIT